MAELRPPDSVAAPQSSQPKSYDEQLLTLGAELARLQQRAGRQRRRWQQLQASDRDVEAARAGETWSATIDAAMLIAKRIANTPAQGIDGLVVKFDAAWWYIILDDSILDDAAAR